MSKQVLNLSFAGLYNNANVLNDQTINGGLLTADNIVIDQPNVAKSRRGQSRYKELANEKIKSLATYNSDLITFTSNKMMIEHGGTWTTLSSSVKSPFTNGKIHYCESNKNFYYCDDKGVMKIDSYSSTPKLAGVTPCLDIDNLSLDTGTFLANNMSVAYRVVLGYKDKNSNLILSAPSSRLTIKNTSGSAKEVKGVVYLPASITTEYFYQVYRSKSINGTPSDELQLVLEYPITATDVTNGYIVFEDDTPEELLGAYLYTNENQEGITQSNYQPPRCEDIALYKNSVFYANTTVDDFFQAALLATDTVPNNNALEVGDTFTIGGVEFLASTSEAKVDDTHYTFILTNNISPAEDILYTVQSLLRMINQSGCKVYGYYQSTGDSDIVGQFKLVVRSSSDTNITIATSKPLAFSPNIPTGTKTQSESYPNRIYFSKPQQPEAVPITNYIDVGSANYEIKRIIALRDSLFILKTDGIYRLSGESVASFNCKLFDGTTKIIASETAVAFNNMVYCVADQGIITISETGVSIISMPIENDLFTLSELSNFSSLAFGIAYPSDRKYILFVPSNSTDTICNQAYVYNSYTQTFVRWTLTRSCGVCLSTNDKQGVLYTGFYDDDNGIVYKERKDFSILDYADDDYDVTITSVDHSASDNETYLTLSSIPTVLTVGFAIKQGNNVSVITAIDSDNSSITTRGYYNFNPYNANVVNGSDKYPITIIDSQAYEVTVTSIPDEVQVGYTVEQDGLSSTITAIDTVNNKFTLSTSVIYEIYNAKVYTPIKKTIEWYPITCNNPSFFKHFREITFIFLDARFRDLSFDVYTDSSPDKENTIIKATSLYAWGYGQWGVFAWGGDVGGRQAIRSYIPLEKSRCRWLDLSLNSEQAFTQFIVSGVSLMYSVASERDTR